MPSRNIYKNDLSESFYHAYARGACKQPIFHESNDYNYFINLFARYLSAAQTKDKTGVPYPHYHEKIELLAYCLMQNHFHLLLYQKEQGTLPQLMHGIMTSYSRYFNLKYKRSGSLFESRYKASHIDQQPYLEHISRYIHLNPRYWRRYPFSSLRFYTNAAAPEWCSPQKILQLFNSREEYANFLEDYEEQKHIIEDIKQHLADS